MRINLKILLPALLAAFALVGCNRNADHPPPVSPSKAIPASAVAPPVVTPKIAGALLSARGGHTATLLPNGEVLMAGGAYRESGSTSLLSSIEIFTPDSGKFEIPGDICAIREGCSTSVLVDGRVLITGGQINKGSVSSAAKIYDLATGKGTLTGNLVAGRAHHTSTLLSDGKVLIAGGINAEGTPLATAEIFDPASGSFTATGTLNIARTDYTAILLQNGKVLMVGGNGIDGKLIANAELYDLTTGTFKASGSFITRRDTYSATLLPNGKVLFAGGCDEQKTTLASAEIYDPANNTFKQAARLVAGRDSHTATLLRDGKVLLAGGNEIRVTIADGEEGGDEARDEATALIVGAEIYDPISNTFTATGHMMSIRYAHSATLLKDGRVLIAGGGIRYAKDAQNENQIEADNVLNAEIYDPKTRKFSPTASLTEAHFRHLALMLPDGKVLIAGVGDRTNSETYDPALGKFISPNIIFPPDISGHTATLMPNGKVLLAGGFTHLGLASAVLYDSATRSFSTTGHLVTPRQKHTATLLANGNILIVGGLVERENRDDTHSAEIYNPKSGQFTTTGKLVSAHFGHTATLLQDGRVLIAGGYGSISEIYDPETGTFTETGQLSTTRVGAAATLLPNGKVLISAGRGGDKPVNSADLYDPATGAFTATGTLIYARANHTSTLLADGKVLIAGGFSSSGSQGTVAMNKVEIYDPASDTFTVTGELLASHTMHTASLLADGRVLIAGGGYDGRVYLDVAELYDPVGGTFSNVVDAPKATVVMTQNLEPSKPALPHSVETVQASSVPSTSVAIGPIRHAGTFSPVGKLNEARTRHTATLLQTGKVLIIGGVNMVGMNGELSLDSTELYDPEIGKFVVSGNLPEARYNHTATLLTNGKVLVTGGLSSSQKKRKRKKHDSSELLSSAVIYDPANGNFTPTGSMNFMRVRHSATLLKNGKMLVIGGSSRNAQGDSVVLGSTELYDPATGTFTASGNLLTQRTGHTATLLPNGKVLVAGGSSDSRGAPAAAFAVGAELYDPDTGQFSPTGNLTNMRYDETATLSLDGKVLILGSFGEEKNHFINNADLYDPISGQFTALSGPSNERVTHAATLLPDGRVLITGGVRGQHGSNCAELYDIASGKSTTVVSMLQHRWYSTATLLPNGKVLIVGGDGSVGDDYRSLDSAELYDPEAGAFTKR